MIRETAGKYPPPEYITKEQLSEIVFRALKSLNFKKKEPFLWEHSLNIEQIKMDALIKGLSKFYPKQSIREDAIILTGRLGSLIFTTLEEKKVLRVLEQWFDKPEIQKPVKVSETKKVNVKLPALREGQRFVVPYGVNLGEAYKKDLKSLARYISKDDIPGLFEYKEMKPGDHIELVYRIIRANEKFITFREWLRIRTDKKTSFYLSDPAHQAKIKNIQTKILNYRQLYVAFVNEKFEIEEGHHRTIAAALLGAVKFPVVVVRLIRASM